MRDWEEIERKIKESGMNAKTWCQLNSINPGTYYSKIYRDRKSKIKQEKIQGSEENPFLEFNKKSVNPPKPDQNNFKEIILNYEEYIINLSGNFDEKCLKKLLKTLKESL